MKVLKIGKKMSKMGLWLTVDGCSYGCLWYSKRHIRSRALLGAKPTDEQREATAWKS